MPAPQPGPAQLRPVLPFQSIQFPARAPGADRRPARRTLEQRKLCTPAISASAPQASQCNITGNILITSAAPASGESFRGQLPAELERVLDHRSQSAHAQPHLFHARAGISGGRLGDRLHNTGRDGKLVHRHAISYSLLQDTTRGASFGCRRAHSHRPRRKCKMKAKDLPRARHNHSHRRALPSAHLRPRRFSPKSAP